MSARWHTCIHRQARATNVHSPISPGDVSCLPQGLLAIFSINSYLLNQLSITDLFYYL